MVNRGILYREKRKRKKFRDMKYMMCSGSREIYKDTPYGVSVLPTANPFQLSVTILDHATQLGTTDS